jgi:hypothetical protein
LGGQSNADTLHAPLFALSSNFGVPAVKTEYLLDTAQCLPSENKMSEKGHFEDFAVEES